MVWCEYHIKKHHIVEQGQYHTLATLLKVLSVRSILLSTPPRLNTRSITDPTFNKLESHTSFSEENPAKRGEVEYLQWGLRILVAAVLKMNIHAYDMLNLEGPRQTFGGKTAMVTMAKNFSSKRGMQYLEHTLLTTTLLHENFRPTGFCRTYAATFPAWKPSHLVLPST